MHLVHRLCPHFAHLARCPPGLTRLRALLLLVCLLGLGAEAAAQTWTERAALPTPRTGAVALATDAGIFVVGGLDETGQPSTAVELYRPAQDVWVTGLPPLPGGRVGATGAVWNDQLYVLGGRDAQGQVLATVAVFSIATGTWSEGPALNTPREGAAAVVINGQLYVVGGSDASGGLLASTERLDQPGGPWRLNAGWVLDRPRAALGTAELDGQAYAVGGFTTLGPWAPVQRFSPLDGTGTASALDDPRGSLAVVSASGRLFALGGRNANNEVVNTAEVFDPEGDAWSPGPPLRQAREAHAAATFERRLYVFGGTNPFGGVLGSTEALFLNRAPRFVTTPPPTTRVDSLYQYPVATADPDEDGLTLTAPILPPWLTFTDNGDGTAQLMGTPDSLDVGTHEVRLIVSDGLLTAEQSFFVQVNGAVSTAADAPPHANLAVLSAPFPTPFRTATTLALTLSQPDHVVATVYDLHGRLVATLHEGHASTGRLSIQWDGTDRAGRPVASGLYICRLQVGGQLFTQPLVRVR